MDMSFNDDLSRIRRENTPQNMAVIKHLALNMIRKIQQKKDLCAKSFLANNKETF